MKFLNEFCYAYSNQEKFTYKSDGFPYLGHSCEMSDRFWGSVRVNVKVKKEINFVPTTDDLTKYGEYFDIQSYNKSVDMPKWFKDLIANYENRERTYLMYLKDREMTKESLQKWITILPEGAYSKLDISTRLKLLERLSNMFLTEDYCSCENMEEVAINLIKYTPKSDADQLLKKLLYSDIYEDLCSHIDGDNYMKFLAELTTKWVVTHTNILNTVNSDYKNAKKLYYWNRVNSTLSGNRYITYKTEYDKGNIDVEFWAGDWVDTRPWEIHNDKLDAQDVILLQCSTIPECFFTNATKNQILTMPAFLFEAMCSKFDLDKKVDYFEKALTVASFFIGVGELGAIAKTWEGASWAKKGWIIWQYTSSTADLLLSNDCIKSKVFNDFLKEYKDAEKWWNMIKGSVNVVGGIRNFDIASVLEFSSGFDAFTICWEAYKATDSAAKFLLEDENAVKDIDDFILSIKSQMKE